MSQFPWNLVAFIPVIHQHLHLMQELLWFHLRSVACQSFCCINISVTFCSMNLCWYFMVYLNIILSKFQKGNYLKHSECIILTFINVLKHRATESWNTEMPLTVSQERVEISHKSTFLQTFLNHLIIPYVAMNSHNILQKLLIFTTDFFTDSF